MNKPFNLPNLSLGLKTAFTGYLVVMSLGLAMSGVQIMLTHGMADGEFGLSVNDIVYSYYGNRENSRLEVKLNGTMKEMASVQDRTAIIAWVRQGSSESAYNDHVGSIFAQNCVRCHGTIPGLTPMTTYEQIKPLAKIDEGASIGALARVSHIHLFGMAFIFFFLVLIFSLSTGITPWLKTLVIAFPFLFLVVDIFSWWVTKWIPQAAYLTIIGGTGYALASAYMILVALYQMWLYPRNHKAFSENSWLENSP